MELSTSAAASARLRLSAQTRWLGMLYLRPDRTR